MPKYDYRVCANDEELRPKPPKLFDNGRDDKI
jgi:hypothetical protein